MKRLLIALALAEVLTTPVLAAPGDPRLVQGTIEWPAALASEPVVIVRGDDGRVSASSATRRAVCWSRMTTAPSPLPRGARA